MATESLSELIKTVSVGEDGDQAYVRLYGSQVKPCDFRRWFTQVKLTGESIETDEATVAKIKEYLTDELTVDEAFKDFCPDYVGPGEFSVAYTKQVMILKAAVAQDRVITIPPGMAGVVMPRGKSIKLKAADAPVEVPVNVPASPIESPLEPAIVPSDVPVSDQTAV